MGQRRDLRSRLPDRTLALLTTGPQAGSQVLREQGCSEVGGDAGGTRALYQQLLRENASGPNMAWMWVARWPGARVGLSCKGTVPLGKPTPCVGELAEYAEC